MMNRSELLVDQPLQKHALEPLQNVLPLVDRRHVGRVEVPEDAAGDNCKKS